MRQAIAVWGWCCLLVLALQALPALAGQAELHGNPQSRIYHNSGCRYYNCKACTVVFTSTKEAKAQGYRACKVCGG